MYSFLCAYTQKFLHTNTHTYSHIYSNTHPLSLMHMLCTHSLSPCLGLSHSLFPFIHLDLGIPASLPAVYSNELWKNFSHNGSQLCSSVVPTQYPCLSSCHTSGKMAELTLFYLSSQWDSVGIREAQMGSSSSYIRAAFETHAKCNILLTDLLLNLVWVVC